ncbi:hypothetical protein [Rubinisphaera brasiliensis]|uniref:Uncharacterized protein n=1 Tax=Rubinisphaera brasiliensis (strain ATCC 49424 / DSM 5305 / JCM 21570 / IAM 15109 / NBRC 103401 / IFAM 1448) TaxID=756272 RepID=F0SKQ9_RUBBR|nr:hypothetical protein [Rubinisphaera brasiliensis]ADY58729.1 hypothetical protein Plabr_1111 [Rubinisphaera brasiliensis DSM 5305]
MENQDEDKLDRIVEAVHGVSVQLESLRTTLQQLETASLDHEKRLRSIERWQNNLTPILAAMTFVLGASFTQVLDRLF